MTTLIEVLPDEEQLLSLEVEELAAFVLRIAGTQLQNGIVSLSNLSLTRNEHGSPRFSPAREKEIQLAVAEAWVWLEANGFLVPAQGYNGTQGFRVFSRRARKLDEAADLRMFARARRIDKSALNPRIANQVWAAFMRAEFDVAALIAMKAVEVAVREAGSFPDGHIGTDLMRTAFHKETGPLTDKEAEVSEREARAHLFAGAIGAYKNALSHRDLNLDHPDEASEIVMLANHLLRIVDRRKAALSAN